MPELESGKPIDEGDRDGWVITYTGKRFYPLDPRPEEIDIVDIAHALSYMPRFTGHTRQFCSVAQHSWMVSRLSYPHQLFGLLHDASEAYLCDISTPVKHNPIFEAYRIAEKRLQQMILSKFGIKDLDMPKRVRDADIIIGVLEGRAFMPEHPGAFWTDFVTGAEIANQYGIRSFSHEEAEGLFLKEFYKLSAGG